MWNYIRSYKNIYCYVSKNCVNASLGLIDIINYCSSWNTRDIMYIWSDVSEHDTKQLISLIKYSNLLQIPIQLG